MDNRELARLVHAKGQVDEFLAAKPESEKELAAAIDGAAGSFLINGLAPALVYSSTDGNGAANGQLVATFVARWLDNSDEKTPAFDGRIVAGMVDKLLKFDVADQIAYRFLQEEAIAYLAALKLYAKAKKSEAAARAAEKKEEDGRQRAANATDQPDAA